MHPIIKLTILLVAPMAAMASHKEVITATILIVMIITPITTTANTAMMILHLDRHDGYNLYPSWNNRYVRPTPPNGYSHNHNDRKHQQFGYQGSVPTYPQFTMIYLTIITGTSLHLIAHGDTTTPNMADPTRMNKTMDNIRDLDNRRNQIKEQRRYDHRNDNRDRHENHEQARDQRERRIRNH